MYPSPEEGESGGREATEKTVARSRQELVVGSWGGGEGAQPRAEGLPPSVVLCLTLVGSPNTIRFASGLFLRRGSWWVVLLEGI